MPFLAPQAPHAVSRLAAGLALAAVATLLPLGSGFALAVEASAPSPPSQPASDGAPRYKVVNTDGEMLRVRSKPGLDEDVIARLPAGALVRLRDDDPVDDDGEHWLPIQTTEVKGWVAGRYLARAVTPPLVTPSLPPDASFADKAVALARAATGQPYVWGGNQPGGFDCSGFVQWVYTQAGIKLPRLIKDQLTMGKKVDRGSLQPGDLVAFLNTYQDGLSHVGVYLGNDLFEHAADEVHGVTVSNIKESYWDSRYYGAVRLR